MITRYVRDGKPVTIDEVKKFGAGSVVTQVFLTKDEVAQGFTIHTELAGVRNRSGKTEVYVCLNGKQYQLFEIPHIIKGEAYTYDKPYKSEIAIITDKRFHKWLLDLKTGKTIFGVDSITVLRILNENIFLVGSGLRWKIFDRHAKVLDETKNGFFQKIAKSVIEKREMVNGKLEITRVTLKDLQAKSSQINDEHTADSGKANGGK